MVSAIDPNFITALPVSKAGMRTQLTVAANEISALQADVAAINLTGVVGASFSTFTKTLLDEVSANAWLAALGLSPFVITLMNDADQATFRSSIGVDLTTLVPTTRQVATQHSLQGGGDLGTNRTLSLVGDTATRGARTAYSTNAAGDPGWRSIFAPHYESAAVPVVSGGVWSVTHGLGGNPHLVSCLLRCKTAQNGIAVGQDINLGVRSPTPGAFIVVQDATTISGRFPDVINYVMPDNAITNISPANFDLIVRAWR